MAKPVVALAGGVGAARFLEGLIRVVPQREITVIGNVGDDIELYGLHVSPDLDIVSYTLVGMVDPEKGWGFRGDTFEFQSMLKRYGQRPWFNLGDRDVATHVFRTLKLRHGEPLSTVTKEITRRLGLRVNLLPATDDPFTTYIVSRRGLMHFQEYMVRRKTMPRVKRVIFHGASSARPTKGVVNSVLNAAGVILCPSNPIVSIGAILAVPGIRAALRRTRANVVGISPIVGGRTIKGPADKMMKALGLQPSAYGVTKYYSDFIDCMIIDKIDRKLATQIEDLGVRALVTDTVMKTMAGKVRLAKLVVRELA